MVKLPAKIKKETIAAAIIAVIIVLFVFLLFLNNIYYFYDPYTKTLGLVPDQNAIDCKLKGGDWYPMIGYLEPSCHMPTTDAGNVCRDDSECESLCQVWLTNEEWAAYDAGEDVYTTGTCYGSHTWSGQTWIIENGLIVGEMHSIP